MSEEISMYAGNSLRNWAISSLIATALALALDYYLNLQTTFSDYLRFFGLFSLFLGLSLIFINIIAEKRLSTAEKSLSNMTGILLQNVKKLEELSAIASKHYTNLDSHIKRIAELDTHVTSIVEASKKGKLFLLPIEEAVKMESQAEEEVFIISCDPELELKDEFYNLVCQNLLRAAPIKYFYFFPKGNDPYIKRGLYKMLKAFKDYGNGNQITDTLLQKQLAIYRVNFILNTIVIIDPYGRKPTGWIFPNAEIERHIVQAEENLIDTAIRQVEHWMEISQDKMYPF